MPRITVELDDTLQDRVEGAAQDFREAARAEMAANPDAWCDSDSGWEIMDALDLSDNLHEIVDSAVPIYTREIETAWFLHGAALEGAYEDAGIGENPRENDGMTAIYCYIDAAVRAEAEDMLEALRDEILSAAKVA